MTLQPTPQALVDIGVQIGVKVLVRGWLSANNLVFGDGPAGACVVDTGYFSHAALTVALVELALVELALAGAPLARVLNTHLHSDHCGGNASLVRRWPGLQISVPEGYRHALLPWDESRLSFRGVDQRCEPFTPQRFLADGDSVVLGQRAWQVHAAPGHDPDAVLLFEPVSRTLISGDALWENRLAIIFPELVGEPGFEAAHQALDLIERLAPLWVLPGHGQPFCDLAAALLASRQRLAAFAAAPVKHRQHAVRALVVYHMLEHRSRPHAALVDWIVQTPLLRQALQCGHDSALALTLATDCVDRLLRDGVLQQQDRQVVLVLA